MPLRPRASRTLAGAVLAAGATLACRPAAPPAPAPSPTSSPAPAAIAVGPYAPRGLLPREVRWYRTSAERRALYLQGYRLATDRLATLAAGRAAGTWAVILDADETVLDNSPYQQARAAADSAYTSESWHRWVERRAAAALPGSVAFLAAVHAAGGRAVIVTNRDARECDATRDNLRVVGLIVDAVLCKTTTSDKNPRFAEVAAGAGGLPPLTVVLWVGDNIQDFPSLAQATARAAPDAAFADFGSRFVLLPNPMYGSWEENPPPAPVR